MHFFFVFKILAETICKTIIQNIYNCTEKIIQIAETRIESMT